LPACASTRFGPWSEAERIRETLLAAGEQHGLVQVGSKAYSTANLESGWVPAPFAAIFTGEEMKAYREWLPAPRAGSLAGSYDSVDITDYYLTPFELGYGKVIAFDHEFVGRSALEAMSQERSREKVTLVWDNEDVAGVFASLFGQEKSAKYIDLPKARYGLYQVDSVLLDGDEVGVSHDCGYVQNEKAFLSLASVDPDQAPIGSEVSVLWGESPNSSKPVVEPHVQVEIRATVAPTPYVQFARGGYRTA
jgi:vanillate/3-O-methylgallate O-demethylase